MRYLVKVDKPDGREFIVEAANNEELEAIIYSEIGCGDCDGLGATYIEIGE